MVDHDGSRVVDAEPLEEPGLERLRLLEPIRAHRIDDGDPEGLVVGQERLRVEEDAAVAARVEDGLVRFTTTE